MKVHLVDGTYELFRHFYALPRQGDASGREAAATRGVVASVLGMLEGGATHVAVATDHVIESFRNQLWPGYKDGSGIDPDLRGQFEPLEEALAALGVALWAMVEHEADDALASGAAIAAGDARVEQVLLCTPDKDLAQCVSGERVVMLDRRRQQTLDEAAVIAKFGVPPRSIPDYLALVGDAADGYPGLPGWGPRSAAVVLARFACIEAIPPLARDWGLDVRGALRLAATLEQARPLALLFRRLATLRADAAVSATVDAIAWTGPAPEFAAIAERLRAPELHARAADLAALRRG